MINRCKILFAYNNIVTALGPSSSTAACTHMPTRLWFGNLAVLRNTFESLSLQLLLFLCRQTLSTLDFLCCLDRPCFERETSNVRSACQYRGAQLSRLSRSSGSNLVLSHLSALQTASLPSSTAPATLLFLSEARSTTQDCLYQFLCIGHPLVYPQQYLLYLLCGISSCLQCAVAEDREFYKSTLIVASSGSSS